jgi:hypothetical protein
MRAKHETGPWRFRDGCVERENINGYWQPIKLYSPWTEGCWATDMEAEANARLIASAPDLLEALLAAEDKHQRGIFNMTDAEIERVHTLRRAAIARATGEAA